MSQTLTFSQTVNKLFFGVDVSDKASSLLDSFLIISQLRHCDTVARQWNINTAMEMESDKACSFKHKFLFTESPLPDLQIENGIIEVRIGETDSIKKLLGLNWNLHLTTKYQRENVTRSSNKSSITWQQTKSLSMKKVLETSLSFLPVIRLTQE